MWYCCGAVVRSVQFTIDGSEHFADSPDYRARSISPNIESLSPRPTLNPSTTYLVILSTDNGVLHLSECCSLVGYTRIFEIDAYADVESLLCSPGLYAGVSAAWLINLYTFLETGNILI